MACQMNASSSSDHGACGCCVCCPIDNSCGKDAKINRCDLQASTVAITYQTGRLVAHFSLPRRYTVAAHPGLSVFEKMLLFVGSDYSAELQPALVSGSWKQSSSEVGCYKLNLCVKVASPTPPRDLKSLEVDPADASAACRLINQVLQAIAIAETALLCRYPKLAQSKVQVHFQSDNCTYDRVECWGTLGQWRCDRTCGGC